MPVRSRCAFVSQHIIQHWHRQVSVESSGPWRGLPTRHMCVDSIQSCWGSILSWKARENRTCTWTPPLQKDHTLCVSSFDVLILDHPKQLTHGVLCSCLAKTAGELEIRSYSRALGPRRGGFEGQRRVGLRQKGQILKGAFGLGFENFEGSAWNLGF